MKSIVVVHTSEIQCLLQKYSRILGPELYIIKILKKESNKWSMYLGPILYTDTGKYCQNLTKLGKSVFLKNSGF